MQEVIVRRMRGTFDLKWVIFVGFLFLFLKKTETKPLDRNNIYEVMFERRKDTKLL